MKNRILFTSSIILILIILIFPIDIRAEQISLPNISTASELIDAVNDLRASNGLPPYTPNSILMDIAQKQAEYILTIGTPTHTNAEGLRPFQRALDAGYAVAGDISQGGFFSENITAGVGMTAVEAVKQWTEDDPHLNTMISTNLQDIGAGMAVVGNTFYYLIDCGLSTGGKPAAYTPPPSYIPPKLTVIPNTLNADGSITYIVQGGDTLLGIAIANNISLDKILALNGLTTKSVIYLGQKIIIQAAYTPTSTLPTQTPTGLPTITPWPTSSPTLTMTPVPPTSTPSSALPVTAARSTVIIIIVAALLVAGFVVVVGRKRE
jgi:LysM repeat protein